MIDIESWFWCQNIAKSLYFLIKSITQFMKNSTCSWFCWSGSHMIIDYSIFVYNILTHRVWCFAVFLRWQCHCRSQILQIVKRQILKRWEQVIFQKGRADHSLYNLRYQHMRHYQGEWVGCRRNCFWDNDKNCVQILLFYIVFRTDKFYITL